MKGEMNANSLRDALRTLVQYAAILEENAPSNGLQAPEPLSQDKRDELIARAVQTQHKRITQVQIMANPIRPVIPIDTEDLSLLAIPNEIPAVSKIRELRSAVRPEFEIANNPTIRIATREEIENMNDALIEAEDATFTLAYTKYTTND